ncbi:MAG: FadR/GntR family transcriptional regulator, partial [Anaerostipes hadrus]
MMNYTSEEKSLPQKISEDIISLILEENLQPGDKLPNESILSKRLDAGRSSIREAMKLLASRNIVTIRQGSGTYVASSPGMVEDPLGFLFIGDKKKLVHDLLEVRFLLE